MFELSDCRNKWSMSESHQNNKLVLWVSSRQLVNVAKYYLILLGFSYLILKIESVVPYVMHLFYKQLVCLKFLFKQKANIYDQKTGSLLYNCRKLESLIK